MLDSEKISAVIKTFMEQRLQHTLHKFSFVTQEEFDIQTEVLAKTRAKLEQLEKILENLQK